MRRPRWRVMRGAGAAAVGVGGMLLAMSTPAVAAPGDTLGPFNPVRDPLGQLVNGHPANSGFLVFVEGDTTVNADESEGTMATGGDFTIAKGYNVAAGSTPFFDTFVAPGDSGSTFLWIGGGVSFPSAAENLEVHNGGYAKINDASTYSALTTDMNDVPDLPTHIVPPGEAYEYSPRIQLQSSQTPASVAALTEAEGMIDIPAAFELYRQTATLMGTCAPTIELLNRDDSEPLPGPVVPGANGRVTLIPDQTNVLNITAADLESLASLTFTIPPAEATPLLVNVTGESFDGAVPTAAGIASVQAHFVIYNFVEATAVTVTGGDSLHGTIYAPYANLNWQVTQNIEGNVIAASFTHGMPLADPPATREVHDFPFLPDITCVERGTPTPTPTPTPPVDPEPAPTETPAPTLPSTTPPSQDAALPAAGIAAGPALVAVALVIAGAGLVILAGAARRARPLDSR